MSMVAVIIISIALGFCIGGLFTLFLYKDYYGYYSEYTERDPIEIDEEKDEPKV